MIDRSAQLQFCQQCLNRDFSPKSGIICKLTGEQATFHGECPDYKVDGKMAHHEALKAQQQQELVMNEETGGLAKYGVKNGFVAGILVIALGIIWIVVGLSFDRLFYYPIFLIGYGVYLMIKAASTSTPSMSKQRPENPDILDD